MIHTVPPRQWADINKYVRVIRQRMESKDIFPWTKLFYAKRIASLY